MAPSLAPPTTLLLKKYYVQQRKEILFPPLTPIMEQERTIFISPSTSESITERNHSF